MSRLTTDFQTDPYEFAHGKLPRAGAGWAFEVDLPPLHVDRLATRAAELGLSVERLKAIARRPSRARIWTGSLKYGEAKTAVRRLLEDVCWDVPAGSTLHVEVCS